MDWVGSLRQPVPEVIRQFLHKGTDFITYPVEMGHDFLFRDCFLSQLGWVVKPDMDFAHLARKQWAGFVGMPAQIDELPYAVAAFKISMGW